VTLANTILANSTSGGNCLPDEGGTIIDNGYNLDNDGSCGLSTANHSLPNTNPQLAPNGLQNNGGPTQTIALQSSSPAIDFIPSASCVDAQGQPLSTDQRGSPRPDNGEQACDSGAYESSYDETTTTLSSSANPSVAGQQVTYWVTPQLAYSIE
jgi:hypothetical protein